MRRRIRGKRIGVVWSFTGEVFSCPLVKPLSFGVILSSLILDHLRLRADVGIVGCLWRIGGRVFDLAVDVDRGREGDFDGVSGCL